MNHMNAYRHFEESYISVAIGFEKKINDMYTVCFMQVYVNKAIMIMGLLNDWEIVDTLSHEFGKAAA